MVLLEGTVNELCQLEEKNVMSWVVQFLKKSVWRGYLSAGSIGLIGEPSNIFFKIAMNAKKLTLWSSNF